MLTLTDTAQAAVRDLTAQAGLPAEGGMRIATTEKDDQLELTLVPAPQPADAVIEDDGARVFVAEDTAPLLSGHALDAGATEQGVGFALRPQE